MTPQAMEATMASMQATPMASSMRRRLSSRPASEAPAAGTASSCPPDGGARVCTVCISRSVGERLARLVVDARRQALHLRIGSLGLLGEGLHVHVLDDLHAVLLQLLGEGLVGGDGGGGEFGPGLAALLQQDL